MYVSPPLLGNLTVQKTFEDEVCTAELLKYSFILWKSLYFFVKYFKLLMFSSIIWLSQNSSFWCTTQYFICHFTHFFFRCSVRQNQAIWTIFCPSENFRMQWLLVKSGTKPYWIHEEREIKREQRQKNREGKRIIISLVSLVPVHVPCRSPLSHCVVSNYRFVIVSFLV